MYIMVLVLLRHGQSLYNKMNKFTGITNIPLTVQGKNEAYNAGKLLRNYEFDYIFTSHLDRTIETAKIVSSFQHNRSDYIRQIYNFQERDYGDLTGKSKCELVDIYGKEQVNQWRRSYYNGPPNGESIRDTQMRVGKAYDNHVKPFVHYGNNVLIVSHGNSLRSLFVHLGIKTKKEIEHFEIDTGDPICVNTDLKTYKYLK